MAIKSIIVDDEKSNIENLTIILSNYCPEVEVVATAQNIVAALDAIKQHPPDLVFLDIEMPLGNGFQLLENFQEIHFEVIFVTAYNQYAIKAIKFCALDYLLKPIDIFELKSAVAKVEQKLALKGDNQKMKMLLQNNREEQPNKRIGLPLSDKVEFIAVKRIIRCKGENNYTSFIIENHSEILVSKTLKEYEDLLHEFGFVRVHQSHLINVHQVRSYVKSDGGYLIMSDGSRVIISRNKKEALLKALKDSTIQD